MGKLCFLFLTTIIGVSTTSFDNDFTGLPLPPVPVITRWGTWLTAAFYYADNFEKIRGFVEFKYQRSKEHFKGTIRNNVLEQQILALLETFRETMLTGSDDLPILDPLQIERLHIDENFIGLPGTRVTINDLVLHYLSTFVVDNLTIRITSAISQQYSVEFEAHIPIIVAETGEYDLFISAMGYDIFGRGDGKLEVIEPKVAGSCTFGLWSMSISNLVIEFSLSKFEPQLTGLFYHEGASNFANAFLANLVPEILDFYKDEIRDFISPLLQDLANELLENVSIGDLFPQLTNNDYTQDRRI